MKTANQKSIFFLDNLDLVRFWVNEVALSLRFYTWLKALIERRYSSKHAGFQEKADELITLVQGIVIPEVDIDQYKITMNISAEQFANRRAEEFRSSSFFSNS